ncbi:MAG: helix-turn-helix transcriptional regulator [Candidatus Sungiibacteriota bacterium]
MLAGSGYLVITDAYPEGDELVVRFANDDVVKVKKTHFAECDRPDILWHELCVIDDGLAIAVPSGFGPIEIPCDEVRRLTDPEFAEDMRRREERQRQYIGRRIHELREKKGLTEMALAARSGITIGVLRSLEEGDSTPLTLIERVLGVMGCRFGDIASGGSA